MTPTSSARKADQEATMTQDADAGGRGLYDAIAHGDDEHRAWLKEAIDAHFAGLPVPEPRGKNSTATLEARLAAAEARTADALKEIDKHIALGADLMRAKDAAETARREAEQERDRLQGLVIERTRALHDMLRRFSEPGGHLHYNPFETCVHPYCRDARALSTTHESEAT